MGWKKNAFSYLIWFVYTVLTGVGLMGIADSLCASMGLAFYWGAAFVFLYALLAWGIVPLLHRFARGHSAVADKKREHLLVLEVLALLLLLAAGIVLRAEGVEGAVQSSPYFEMAKVAAGQKIPQTVHGAVYFYVQVLHMVFGLLGNHFLAGIWLQIVLQLAAMVVLYFTVRRLAGAMAALVTFGFGMCAPYMVRSVLVLSPEMLYFLILSVAGAVVVALGAEKAAAEGDIAERDAAEEGIAYETSGKRTLRKKKRASGGLRLPAFFFMGMVAALCCYIDIMGMLILFLALAMVFCRRRAVAGIGRKMAAAALCLLGAGLGFGACVLSDAFLSGKSFTGVAQAWLRLYAPGEFRLPVVIEGIGDGISMAGTAAGLVSGSRTEEVLLLALMGFGVFSFWCDRWEERISVCVLSVIGITLASCYGIFTDEMPGFFVLYLLFAVLAGLGPGQCFLVSYDAQMDKAPETESSADIIDQETQKKDVKADTSRRKDDKKGAKVEAAGSEEREKGAEVEVSSPKGQIREVGQEKSEDAGEKEIRYLENPLPLPKKHVRRVMDYALTSAPEEDDFDYSVSEDDDFDI